MRYDPHFKRALDFILALMAWLVFSPFLAAAALLIRIESPGPSFFLQQRMGKDKKPFRLVKLRSMTVKPEAFGGSFDAGNSRRITRLGRMLRQTKIDELPELFNVLRGEMGIVGPRPEVRPYVEAFPEAFDKILRVRPGLTDYASIKYRNEEELLALQADPEAYYRTVILPDKLQLACRYMGAVSWPTDRKIILATIRKIVVS